MNTFNRIIVICCIFIAAVAMFKGEFLIAIAMIAFGILGRLGNVENMLEKAINKIEI